MRDEERKILFALIKSAITGEESLSLERSKVQGLLQSLLEVSRIHDISPLVSLGMAVNGIKENEGFRRLKFNAIYRYELQNHAFEKICQLFESSGIPFIPLKGASTRKYYREPWSRTCGDIDILVHENDLDRASTLLVEKMGCTKKNAGAHDISFYSPNGQHFELHFSLLEESRTWSVGELNEKVWKNATLRDGMKNYYEMAPEMFYAYHIAHMAKHIENGGCGLRPFVDLWILRQHCFGGGELIENSNLLLFEKACVALTDIWFSNGEYNDTLRALEQFIFEGGVYGNIVNRIDLQQVKKGGKVRYLFSRVFLPAELLVYQYPIIKKHFWLMPFCQIARWFKKRHRGVRELSMSVLNKPRKEIKEMLVKLGL